MSSVERLTVRPAVPSDVVTLVKFNAALALETEGRRLDLNRLRQGTLAVFASPARGRYLVAEVPAQPLPHVVGQLLVTFEWSDWRNAPFWWLQSVYVDPAWRRRGVFRQMYRTILEMARAEGVCGIRLYVEAENTVAQAVYRRLGLGSAGYVVWEQDFVMDRQEKGRKGEGGQSA